MSTNAWSVIIFNSNSVSHSFIPTPLYIDFAFNYRQDNLEKFREGEQQFLVCTDLAARGLDIPEIDHVIMFDFPLNPVDYIHR